MKYKVVTFDVYSAFYDLEGSIVPQLNDILGLKHDEIIEFFRTWRNCQWNYVLISNSLNKGFISYEHITRSALEYTLVKFRIDMPESKKDLAMEAWMKLKPWSEASEILNELKDKGYIIAILSNGDEKMLEELRRYSKIPFDYIFCAEQAGAYKPNKKIYDLPYYKLSIQKNELLHVAGSSFDMLGAVAAGIDCYWSNRKGNAYIDNEYRPMYEGSDLNGLKNILLKGE